MSTALRKSEILKAGAGNSVQSTTGVPAALQLVPRWLPTGKLRWSGLLVAASVAAGCTFPPPLSQQAAVQADEQQRYTIVQPGESVSVIAARTGIPTSAIIRENQLAEPFMVYPGQRLELPAARFYRVGEGDTLYRVARAHGVDVDALAQANQLDTPHTIFIGQSLRIPDGVSGAPSGPVVAERPTLSGHPVSQPSSSQSGAGFGRSAQASDAPQSLTGASTGTTSRSDRSVTATPLDGPVREVPSSPTPAPQAPNQTQTQTGRESTASLSDMTASPVASDRQDEPGTVAVSPSSEEAPASAPAIRSPEPPQPPPRQAAAPETVVSPEQANLPAVSAPAARSSDRFSWPADGAVISTFGPKDGGQHNDGINIEAPRGAAIRAADNGVVAYAGSELRGYGNLIILRHADGWVTAYGHADRILVQRGQAVSVGDTIGEVGSTGSVSSPQIHFEIRQQSRPVDPMEHLSPRS